MTKDDSDGTNSQTLKRAVVYLRVSTARQAHKDGEEEGYSLPAQREACARKAESLGAVVVDEYIDAGASARSADRPRLQALLTRLRDDRDVDYVIVHKVDRLARNMADQVAINLTLQKANAQLVSVSEAIDESPSGMLLLAIMAGVSEFYSNNLGHEARKGIHQKVLKGGTPSYAPLGYLNQTERIDGHEVKSIVVDPDRAPHITWMFQTYATGQWSITDLVDELAARGMCSRATAKLASTPLTRSQVHRILKSEYYLGRVVHKGVAYPGRHEPLIDEATWQQVQTVLASRRHAGDRSWSQGHYLIGSVYCGRCSERLGFGYSRGRNGTKYGYFFCLGRSKKRTDCQLPYLDQEQVEAAVARNWATVQLDRETIQAMREQVLQALDDRDAQGRVATDLQRSRLAKLERTKTKLVDAYLADAIPVDELKRRQEGLAVEIQDAQRRLAEATADRDLILERLEIVLDLLNRCDEFYATSAEQDRRLLNQAVFTRFDINVTEVPQVAGEMNLPFTYLRDVAQAVTHTGSPQRAKACAHKGSTTKNPGLFRDRGSNVSLLAERVGFEPTVRLPAHLFSRQASSTTPAPLQMTEVELEYYT